MKIHPIADLMPRMSDEDYAALRADIATHGVREPAWTWNKQVIDGRHRVQACEDLGIKCPTREYEGTEDDLVSFVVSVNVNRRHLDTSQRAMVAQKVRERLSANLHSGDTASVAAEMLNVSRRSVIHASTVADKGVPELKEAVEKGGVSVSAAAKVAELPKAEQRKAVKEGNVAEKANKPKPEKPKNDEVERLKAELEDALGRAEEMAKAQQPLQDEVDFLRKIEDEGDKLKAACAEVKRLQVVVRGQEERIRGLMNEVADYKQHSKKWQRMYEKAVRGAQK